jgi:hypothetical protein
MRFGIFPDEVFGGGVLIDSHGLFEGKEVIGKEMVHEE